MEGEEFFNARKLKEYGIGDLVHFSGTVGVGLSDSRLIRQELNERFEKCRRYPGKDAEKGGRAEGMKKDSDELTDNPNVDYRELSEIYKHRLEDALRDNMEGSENLRPGLIKAMRLFKETFGNNGKDGSQSGG